MNIILENIFNITTFGSLPKIRLNRNLLGEIPHTNLKIRKNFQASCSVREMMLS